MNTEVLTRRLSAILSADVEGYSRLMREDEEATVRTITTHRAVMAHMIQQYRGRVVDSPGDNILAEFSSVVDAVNCAVEIQRELSERNEELPENRRMLFRIGINLGDVLEEGERIYGDGVNIAARMESLAEAGGICISGTVYSAIENRIGLEYEDLGEHEVKNINKPIRAYKVLSYPGAAAHRVVKAKKHVGRTWRNAVIAVAALLVLGAAAGVRHFYLLPPPMEPASVENMAFPLPDKPSIAVLPFDNMSGDPSQEYFSDGLAEEIITALSKVPQLFVVARNSTFSYKGKSVKVNQIAEDLGVRYVLEGGVRKEGKRVRITAQLIDALAGHHVWAERYDRDLEGIFALQDEITKNVITALQVELTQGEQARISAKGTDNLDAYLKCLEGHEHLFRFNKDDNLQARRKAEEVIRLDPEYSDAYSLLGKTHILDVWFNWSGSPKESMGKAYDLAKRALALKEYNFEAHRILSHIYLLNRRHEEAVAECERALALAPGTAESFYNLGIVLRFSGRAEESVQMLEKAIRLNPRPPASYLYMLGLSYAFTGEFEKAIAVCKKALPLNPNDLVGRISLAVAYSSLGREEEARREAEEVLRIDPHFTLEYASRTWPYKDVQDRDFVFNALRKAGLPEIPPLPLPDKPSIAVLPLENMSGDPEQEYFADGITEEIITALSKTQRLFVIARNSTFTYKGKHMNVQQVGRELGVKYVVEGSVRKSEGRVRITAQLIDALDGSHVWAERYDRPIGEIFAVQDEITLEIVKAMRVSLTEGEQGRLIGKGTKSLDAYLKAMQAREQFYLMNRQGSMKAKAFSNEAISLDPNYAFPYTTLANAHMLDAWFNFSQSSEESMRLAAEAAHKALALDDSDPSVYSTLTNLYVMERQYDKAIAAAERGIAISPGGARAQVSMGIALLFSCRFSESIPFYERAIRLNPYPPSLLFRNLAHAYKGAERYEEALSAYRKALQLNPDDIFTHLSLADLYVLLGRVQDARVEAGEVLRIHPDFSLDHYARTLTLKDPSFVDKIVARLREAGLK